MGKVIMKRKWKLRLSLKATMLVLLQFNKDAGSKKVRYANNKTASMRFVYAHPNPYGLCYLQNVMSKVFMMGIKNE